MLAGIGHFLKYAQTANGDILVSLQNVIAKKKSHFMPHVLGFCANLNCLDGRFRCEINSLGGT